MSRPILHRCPVCNEEAPVLDGQWLPHLNVWNKQCNGGGNDYVDPVTVKLEQKRVEHEASRRFRREMAPPPGLGIRTAAQVMEDPQTEEVISGFAARGCITVVTAESGGSKSFVMLDASSCVSGGRLWHGRATTLGAVVYLMFEGDDFGRRLRALRFVDKNTERLYVRRCYEALTPFRDRDGVEDPAVFEEQLVEELRALDAKDPIAMIVFDTVRASHCGSEDDSKEVSAYLRAIRRIVTGALLKSAAAVLVHHTGWLDGQDPKKRERGSSAFRGNVDYAHFIEVVSKDEAAGETILEMSTSKVKDGARPRPLGLRVSEVTVEWMDRKTTSCVVESLSADEIRNARSAAHEVKFAEIKTAILQVLKEGRRFTVLTELAKAIKRKAQDVREALAELDRDGHVRREKRGAPWLLLTQTPF